MAGPGHVLGVRHKTVGTAAHHTDRNTTSAQWSPFHLSCTHHAPDLEWYTYHSVCGPHPRKHAQTANGIQRVLHRASPTPPEAAGVGAAAATAAAGPAAASPLGAPEQAPPHGCCWRGAAVCPGSTRNGQKHGSASWLLPAFCCCVPGQRESW
eukprot:scaffold149635_cov16-Tisochrysis_lutea.AAC.1